MPTVTRSDQLGPPSSGHFQAGDIVIDISGAGYRCVREGYPGEWNALTDFAGGFLMSKVRGVGIKVDIDSPSFGWRDIIGPISPKVTGVGSPARAVYRGGTLADYAFVLNDLVDMSFHIPHDYAYDTDLYYHVHWSHNGTAISGNVGFTAYFSYSKGHNQQAFSTEKSIVLTRAVVRSLRGCALPDNEHVYEEPSARLLGMRR